MKELLLKLSDVYADGISVEDKLSPSESEALLGALITNRTAGIAYTIIRGSTSQVVAKDHERALAAIYAYDVRRAKTYIEHVKYISCILENADFDYALLKGAYLITNVYPLGTRTSNDIDILVRQEDLSKLHELMIKNGFEQGYISNRENVIPATRAEIVAARMNRGETVPYVKMHRDVPLEVDVNFAVGFSPDDDRNVTYEMLEKTTTAHVGEYEFSTLSATDFFIHLCCHLYKEATTYDWITMGKDLLLYKFSDINLIWREQFENRNKRCRDLINRIKELSCERECAYAMTHAGGIFDNLYELYGYKSVLASIIPTDTTFLSEIICPREKVKVKLDMPFCEWLFYSKRAEYIDQKIGEMKNEK